MRFVQEKSDRDLDLGLVLVEKGMVGDAVLQNALKLREENESLQETLERLGIIQVETILDIVSKEFGLFTMSDLGGPQIDPDVVHYIDVDRAKKDCCISLFKIENELVVALSNPFDMAVIDEIHQKTGFKITPVLSSVKEIKDAIRKYYKAIDEFKVEEKLEAEETTTVDFDLDLPTDTHDSEPVRIVKAFVKEAVEQKCSDIHIEMQEDGVYIRFREAGMLKDVKRFPPSYHSGIISRIKIMAKMDIAEKRKPQDGRIRVKAAEHLVDFRISSFPTVFGEKAVLRLLDATSTIVDLAELGLSKKILEKFEHIIKQPYGMILLTGPTGSGKTTSLYAALKTINTRTKNIITIEDPVEYKIKGINQSEVNVKAGFTFANGLRSILRQDPDVIMVGEIRDGETADIAINAALTGHVVFSTLHTNDAVGTITRLLDLGAEPFMVSASLLGVMAQRLVRKLCPHCRQEIELTEPLLKDLGFEDIYKDIKISKALGTEGHPPGHLKIFKARGCLECQGTGYKGRMAITEFMEVSSEIKNMIQSRKSEYEIKEQAVKEGMLLLQEDGIKKILLGLTSLDEVKRVTQIL